MLINTSIRFSKTNYIETISTLVSLVFNYICHVKIMSVIVSVLFLSLTLLPCDEDAMEDYNRNEAHYNVAENHDHNAEPDFCSPFCQCHCCHTHITTEQIPHLNYSLILISETTSNYTYNIGKDISDSLLQPPQL